MKKPTPTPIRDLADVDPEITALQAKKRELQELRDANNREVADLHERISRYTVSAKPELEGDVAAMLADVISPDTPVTRSAAEARERLTQIQRQDGVIIRSLSELDSRLNAARVRASRVVCDEIREEYAGHVRAIATALIASHEARKGLNDLFSRLDQADVARSSFLDPIQPDNLLGTANDSHSRLGIWLRDAVKSGAIRRDEIPVLYR